MTDLSFLERDISVSEIESWFKISVSFDSTQLTMWSELGPDLHALRDDQEVPLFVASAKGRAESVRSLGERGGRSLVVSCLAR